MLLGNDTQLVNILATGAVDHSLLIGLGEQLGDGHAAPIDGFAFMHDDGLSHAVHWVLIDLQIDDTVATGCLRIRTHDRVAQYTVRAAHVVCLTVDADIFAFAEIVLLYFLDLRQDGQLQDIDAVGSCDFADEAVRYLACRSRLCTQVGGAVLNRSALPVIRQLALTNGYRVAQDKYRIYLEEQFPHIIATTVGFLFVLVSARLHQIDGGVGSGRRPCIGQGVLCYACCVAKEQRLVEMQIGLYDTVATMDRVVIGNNGVILQVVFAVITDDAAVITGIEVFVDGVLWSRPSCETQSEDGVHFDFAFRPNGIYISTGTPDVLASPNDRVALTSGQLFRVLVALRSCRDDCYGQLIDAITTLNGCQTVVVNTVRGDVLTMPDEHLALRPLFALTEVVRLCFVEVDTLNPVATVR